MQNIKIFGKKGFTLMEILIVVVVMGLLAGVAMPYYRQHLDRQKSVVAISNLRMFADSVERYMALHNETVPTDLSLLDLDIEMEPGSTEYNDGNFLYSVVSGSDGKRYVKGARITGEYALGYSVNDDDYESGTDDGNLVCVNYSSNDRYCQDRLNLPCPGSDFSL